MSSSENDENGHRGPQSTSSGFSALPAGARLADRYVVESVIGAGSFDITYRARDAALGKPCVLKEHFPLQFAYRDGVSGAVRPSDTSAFRWTLDRFLQDGRALSRCHHPAIVGVSGVFEAGGTAYMALEFEPGINLEQWLEQLGRAPTQDEIDTILVSLLDALAWLHAHDVFHRDIWPGNILIGRHGRPCLIDFGATRQAIAERAQDMSPIVRAGYSPPEQYTASSRAYGPRSDIYALAATMYRALTGQPPIEAIEREVQDDLLPLTAAVAYPEDYRRKFLEAIDAGLRLRPSRRPQSAAEWHRLLALPGAAPVHRSGAHSEPPAHSSGSADSGRRNETGVQPPPLPRAGPWAVPAPSSTVPPIAVSAPVANPAAIARAARERDARLGRKLVFTVGGATILLFGSNFLGAWETSSQREARVAIERKQGGPIKQAEDRQLKLQQQQAEDRDRTARLAREREARRDAADKAARQKIGDASTARRPPLSETDCQTSKPIENVVAACSEIISRFNDYADAFSIRGWALRERNHPERALTDFNRALEIAPNTPIYLSQRGLTYLRLKDFDRAVADYHKAIDLNPRNAAFINDRGVAYMELRDYPSAIKDFDRAIELDPRYVLSYNNRARAYALGHNDHARAIADLDRAIAINPKYGLAYENRGFSYLDIKDLDRAIADFSRAIELNPRSARGLNGRGVAYERKGDRLQAVADYRRAYDADRKYSAARDNLTRLGEKL